MDRKFELVVKTQFLLLRVSLRSNAILFGAAEDPFNKTIFKFEYSSN